MRSVRHKFNAKPVKLDDGKFFRSSLEYKYYEQLLLRQKAGDVLFFLREVPVQLSKIVTPGKKDKWLTYKVDFVEFLSNGEVVFTETKGSETETYKKKKALFESIYPVKLNVVKRV